MNGNDTRISDVPWQVSLQATAPGGKDTHFCGGSIVDEFHILTAAHCVEWIQPEHLAAGVIKVKAGGTGSLSSLETLPAIEKIYFNSNYALEKTLNPKAIAKADVAIIELSSYIDYSDTIRAIDMDFGSLIETDHTQSYETSVFISGWGDDGSDEGPEQLQSGFMTITSCAYGFCQGYRDHSSMYFEDDETRAGQGDSGGPAVALNEATGEVQLVGITWYGPVGEDAPPVSVYTKVGYFAEWVWAVMGYDELPRNAVEITADGVDLWE